MLPNDTVTGLGPVPGNRRPVLSRTLMMHWYSSSLAPTVPPGLSTRATTAFTRVSAAAARSAGERGALIPESERSLGK